MSQPQRHYRLADYFAIEEMSAVKHEFYRGEIFAMAGASIAHNLISGNILALLKLALRRRRCDVFGSDLRIATPGGLHTYPDISVICGGVELLPGAPDTATNPVLIMEILSPATRDYDRGDKLDLYKAIPSFREYLLIEQSTVRVEHFIKKGRVWQPAAVTGKLTDMLRLRSIRVDLPMKEVYRGV